MAMLTTQHNFETVTYRFYVVYNVEISLYNDIVNMSIHSTIRNVILSAFSSSLFFFLFFIYPQKVSPVDI